MPGDKERLYIALYPSGVVGNEERKYHRAFLIGPKVEKGAQVPGRRCHVNNRPNPDPSGPSTIWRYEDIELSNVQNTNSLLVRVMIAKIVDVTRLLAILRSIPVVQNNPNWRCRTWCANALAAIAADGKAVGTSVLDWQRIEHCGRQYASQKTAEGRFATSSLLMRPKPTWDLLNNKEVVP